MACQTLGEDLPLVTRVPLAKSSNGAQSIRGKGAEHILRFIVPSLPFVGESFRPALLATRPPRANGELSVFSGFPHPRQ